MRVKISIYIILIFGSCATINQKEIYTTRALEGMKRYGGIKFSESLHPLVKNDSLSKKYFEKVSMKSLKRQMKNIEMSLALFPDSSVININGSVDSFYTNSNKIKYIKRHSLLSTNKHFLY